MKAQVICRVRHGTTLTFNIRGDEAVVGREPGMAVSVPMEGVSRQHARILWDGKFYWIEDLKSTNGTFLNGQPVEREKLRHLDVITLGKKLDMVFVVRAAAQAVTRLGIIRAALSFDAPDALPYEMGVGEVTLGRSPTCNIVSESGVVSKLHAKIERTADQLLLQDLGSSNGTYVNGVRVMTAFLQDADVVSLGGVDNYRATVEMGEITSSSGSRPSPAPTPAPEGPRPQFSSEWKTRFEWDSSELQALQDFQRQMIEKSVPGPRGTTKPLGTIRPNLMASPAGPQPASPAPVAPKPASAPAASRPAAAPKSGPPPQPPTPPARPELPTVRPTSAKLVAPRPPSPLPAPAPPPAPAPSAIGAESGRVTEVRLTGPGFALVATETGAHDLGRAKDAGLRVNNPTVSRQHARVIISDDRSVVYLQDMGGANGTLLNGVAIDKLQMLSHGDVIRIGDVQLTVALKRA